jgi:hypothetical protein
MHAVTDDYNGVHPLAVIVDTSAGKQRFVLTKRNGK